jgi:Fe-S-cluster containining protein
VWVTNEEIAALAAEIGEEDIARFVALYVRSVGVRKSLREYSDGACVFFDPDARKCTVYHARPRQCRTWPFWDSNLRTPDAWQATCEICPGSGKGKLVQLGDIETQRKLVKV